VLVDTAMLLDRNPQSDSSGVYTPSPQKNNQSGNQNKQNQANQEEPSLPDNEEELPF
jgi:hypothetical protein